MLTLRCTQKLLARGVAESPGPDVPPTSLLGDWYANVLVSRRQHLVLCVSERTLLPVLLAAKDAKSLPARLPAAVHDMLLALGIAPHAAADECAHMAQARVGRTANRRVLGTMNDFVLQVEHGLHGRPDRSLLEHALWLASTPCKPIDNASPDRATQALFLSASVVEKARAGSLP